MSLTVISKRPKRWSPLCGKAAIVSPEGDVLWEDPDFVPNYLLDEGEASILNVYYREQSNPAKHLCLLTAAPAETATMAILATTEVRAPGSDGYARQELLAANWSAPALDSGDMRTSHSELSFGPVTTNPWNDITHVGVVTAATGQSAGSGLFIQAIPMSGAQSVSVGVYFRYTLRVKAQ